MEYATIQLTIERVPGQDALQPLSRHRILSVTEFPAIVQGEEVVSNADGSKSQNSGKSLFSLEGESRWHRLSTLAGGPSVNVNGKPVEGGVRLSIGDRISCIGYEYGYYVQHKRVGVAFSSQFLATIAKSFAVLFIVLELLSMVALPVLFARASMWNSIVASQRINNKLDSLRKQAGKLEVESFVARAILGELENELEGCARYIRQNGMQLRRSQRRRIQTELTRMEAILEYLASGQPIPADIVRKPSLDEAVKRIVGE